MTHAGPDKLQRIDVSGCPLLLTVARNACVAPSSTLAGFGDRFSAISLVIAKVAVLDFAESARLVAVTCTVAGDGRSAGAVYTPADVIVPSVAFPPETPFTLQLTAVSVVPVTFALNVAWFPSTTDPLVDVTLTAMHCAGGGGSGGDAPPAPQPNVHACCARSAITTIVVVLDLFPFLCERGRMPAQKQAKGQRKGMGIGVSG